MGEIQVARDLPELDDNVVVFARIFNTVWVIVEEKLKDGTVIVSHAGGGPLEDKAYFEQSMSVAGGMFAISGNESVLEVRVNRS